MKRKIKGLTGMAVILLLVVSLVLGGCSSSDKPSNGTGGQAESYKIGAILDISGTSSSLGVPERDTLLMMVDKINAQGGIQGHPIELLIEDNKSDETEAVLAANKLIEKDVVAILGCSASGTTMAIVKPVQNAKIPLISMAAASSIVEPVAERQWVFKTAQSDIIMIKKIMEYLQKNSMTKIAFMYMNNAYGDNGKKAIEAAATQSGVSIVVEEKFDATDNDMTPQLTKVKSSGAQAVVVWAIPPSASILTKNFKELGLTIPLIHSHGVGNQKFIELAQGAADGVILPIGKMIVADQIADSDPQKAVLTQYITDYQNKYQSMPNSFGGYAADALSILVAAIEKAGTDPAALRDQLEKTQGLVGVSGIFTMTEQDHNGLSEDSTVMVQIENDKWKLLQ
ncbi:ABC transporter substrate-binding protein [Dehalobacter sp. DCM]|uniref:ABC transporter substrate-binding protein n=1 Tax=Dehalobacter sp. DCM TaxID=2907827 RepID=UPI003FCC7CD5